MCSAAVALLAGGLSLPSAGATPPCEVVRLATQDGSPWGTVTDIEVVDGRTLYYGSYRRVDPDGSVHQRAVVWDGLHALPQEVGPGLEQDIAFDLTARGLVSGLSFDAAAGYLRPWTYDLTTRRRTWVDTARGPAEARDVIARRLNDSGAATGSAPPGKGAARALDAVAWDSHTGEPRVLPSGGRHAMANGINDRGDRAGFVERVHLKGDGRWAVWDPTVWYADGTVRTAARAGIDGAVREINESGQMAGGTWWGFDPSRGQFEAAFWPSPDEVVALGTLQEGAWSEAFGMDDGGSAVGWMERFASGPHASPWGTVVHNFLWQGQHDSVRILPSLHSVATGQTDWREWYSTGAAHAVHTGLDQVGASTHAEYAPDGSPVGAPTVFRSASSCGELVATVHGTPRMDLTEAKAVAAQREALRPPS